MDASAINAISSKLPDVIGNTSGVAVAGVTRSGL
jgi:hypothetical protein